MCRSRGEGFIILLDIPGKRIQAVGFKVDECHDSITKLGWVRGEEHGVIQAAGGPKGKRQPHEPPSRVLHSAASRDGAAAPTLRDAMAPCIAARAKHAYTNSTNATTQLE